jgi:hypothetical protein
MVAKSFGIFDTSLLAVYNFNRDAVYYEAGVGASIELSKFASLVPSVAVGLQCGIFRGEWSFPCAADSQPAPATHGNRHPHALSRRESSAEHAERNPGPRTLRRRGVCGLILVFPAGMTCRFDSRECLIYDMRKADGIGPARHLRLYRLQHPPPYDRSPRCHHWYGRHLPCGK